MTWKFRDGSQYQASSAGIAKYLNRAGAKLEENTEKLQQLNTINLAELSGQGGRTRRMDTEGSKAPNSRQTETSTEISFPKDKTQTGWADLGWCN